MSEQPGGMTEEERKRAVERLIEKLKQPDPQEQAKSTGTGDGSKPTQGGQQGNKS